MTLVMAWRSEEMLTVCADTRISNGKSPITDAGQKIFQVSVDLTLDGVDDIPIRKLPVGYAFAGNTLMAQSCGAVASTCLSSLCASNADSEVSPSEIAGFFARSAEYVTKERYSVTGQTSDKFEIVVFGWDTIAAEPYVYHIEVDADQGLYKAACSPVDVTVNRIAYFGSGAPFLNRKFAEIEASAEPKAIRPRELLEAAIASSDLNSVGGSLQFATATKNGVRLRPIMRVSTSGMAEFEVLGCNMRRLMDASGLFPGAGAVAIEVGDEASHRGAQD